MKMIRWTIRKSDQGYKLGVCFDSDADGIDAGHDQCGTYATIREAVEAAYNDRLSAPDQTENETLRDMPAEDRIARAVARVESELADGDEAEVSYPLTDSELV